jgi:hypothetical protein
MSDTCSSVPTGFFPCAHGPWTAGWDGLQGPFDETTTRIRFRYRNRLFSSSIARAALGLIAACAALLGVAPTALAADSLQAAVVRRSPFIYYPMNDPAGTTFTQWAGSGSCAGPYYYRTSTDMKVAPYPGTIPTPKPGVLFPATNSSGSAQGGTTTMGLTGVTPAAGTAIGVDGLWQTLSGVNTNCPGVSNLSSAWSSADSTNKGITWQGIVKLPANWLNTWTLLLFVDHNFNQIGITNGRLYWDFPEDNTSGFNTTPLLTDGAWHGWTVTRTPGGAMQVSFDGTLTYTGGSVPNTFLNIFATTGDIGETYMPDSFIYTDVGQWSNASALGTSPGYVQHDELAVFPSALTNAQINQMQGAAVVAPAQVSPTSASFGSIRRGRSSTATTFTFTNNNLSATVTASLTGTDASQFTLSSNTCNGVLVANAGTCTVKAAFSPSSSTTTGTKTANLQWDYTVAPGGTQATITGVGSPITAPLTGNAT